MPSWIAAWIGLFAIAGLVAVLLDHKNRRDNLPVAGVLVIIAGVSVYILVAR